MSEKLDPHNRKAVYHTLGKTIGELRQEKATVASAMAVAKLASEMQKILQFNLSEYKTKREEPQKYPDFKMVEIEKDFD